MIGVLNKLPNPPWFVIVNVPPWTSSGFNFLVLARSARSATVTLRLEVKGKTKLVRSANRVRVNIERYHLRGYGMRRLKEGGYELTLPCKNEADLKKRISALLEDIGNEAARDDCVVEAEVQKRDDNQPGD